MDNYKDAIRFLEKVSEGKVELGATSLETPAEGEYSGGSVVSTRDKVFGPDTLDKY